MLTLSTLQAMLIALTLTGYPLVAALSTALNLNGSTLSIAMRAAVVSMSIILIVRNLHRVQKSHLKYVVIFITFWVTYIIRVAVDTTDPSSQLTMSALEYWIWAVGVCLIPSMGLVGVSFEHAMLKAFNLTWLALGFSSALSLYFGSTVVTGLDASQINTGRLALDLLNPISMGNLGTSLAIFSGWYWCTKTNSQSEIALKVASLFGMLLGLSLLILSASRGPLLGFVCVLVVTLLTLKLRKLIKITALASLVVIALVPAVSSYIELESLQITARVAAISGGVDLSVISRQDSFAGAWNQFLGNPLFGDFLEERSTGFYPHNLTLEAFMATGLIGGLAFLAISIIAFRKAYRMIQLQLPHAWAGLIFIQYLVGAQMSGAIYSSSAFWSFAVLLIFCSSYPLNPRSQRLINI